MTGRHDTLLTAASLAPSGDNLQPWRWSVDADAGVLSVCVDESRDRSPMNAGQRMARVAVGAAVENVLRTARFNGWAVEWLPARPPALAAIRLADPGGPAGSVEPIVAARVTNRRVYDGRPVSEPLLAQLRRDADPAAETVSDPLPVERIEGVRTHWITDRARLESLADLVARCDVLMFGEPSMRGAFLANVRFDLPATAKAEVGLSLGSLELSRGDRMALGLLARLPNWLVHLAGALRRFAAHARNLVRSASGLCLGVSERSGDDADLAVGRAMQRAWLALTAAGLAVQPMMSLVVLANARLHGSDALLESLGRSALEAALSEFGRLVPEMGAGQPVFLLRFGFAPPPSGRTGRLPLAASLAPPTAPRCPAAT
jgi:hypothetical protein